MATSKQQSHPLRTLIVLFAVIAGLFAIMAANNLWTPRLGLDLRGGTTITLTASNLTGGGSVDPKSLELARQIIQQRVDSLGVGETEVTTSGDRQIVVTAPNAQKDELVKMVGQTAQLNFRQVYSEESLTSSTTNRRLLPELPTPVPSPRPTAAANPEPSLAKKLAWTPSARDLSDFASFQCSEGPTPDVTDQPLITCDQKGENKYLLGPVLIKGDQVARATAGTPQNSVAWVINLEFKPQGTADFGTVTKNLYGQQSPKNQLGIVLDGEVISSPAINEPILSGRAEISGDFTQKTAGQLATVLSYGSLPLSFEISSVDIVSAKLGADQLQAGLIAGLIGMLLVVGYSVLYYRGLAVVVTMSLVVAASITWPMMVLLGEAVGFALNLPGIAGAIVAIGVTADSFIIYFERIRDEVREGRGLRTAIETGWIRSRKTILAADSISLLSAVVLFVLAVGAVKGFAFTLGLTTVIDILVVFFFTKPLMTLLGRTKFFGQGHRFSGFEASHMGLEDDDPATASALAGGKA